MTWKTEVIHSPWSAALVRNLTQVLKGHPSWKGGDVEKICVKTVNLCHYRENHHGICNDFLVMMGNTSSRLKHIKRYVVRKQKIYLWVHKDKHIIPNLSMKEPECTEIAMRWAVAVLSLWIPDKKLRLQERKVTTNISSQHKNERRSEGCCVRMSWGEQRQHLPRTRESRCITGASRRRESHAGASKDKHPHTVSAITFCIKHVSLFDLTTVLTFLTRNC